MICLFCGNRVKCWKNKSDEALSLEWVKCGYDGYVLDEQIDLDDLIAESNRRMEPEND
ncbi:MAG: hypothetical protein K2N73_14395 [Lachnospiraceae bacterium]|nr:hypothetical protein [Lachnospiraceae bacterium]